MRARGLVFLALAFGVGMGALLVRLSLLSACMVRSSAGQAAAAPEELAAQIRTLLLLAAATTLLGVGIALLSIRRLRGERGRSARSVRQRTRELSKALRTATERAQAAAESRARLDAIVDTAVDGIITIDDRGLVVAFNRAAETLFGYGAQEVVGQNISMLMPSPFREQHDGMLARYRETGKRHIIGSGVEVAARRKDGSVFPAYVSVSEVHIGDQRWFTGLVRDLTESNTHTAAIEAAADMVVITDSAGRIQYVNRAFTKCTGYALAEVTGKKTSVLKSGRQDGAFYKRLWETILDGRTWSGELINRRKDGSLYPEEMTVAPVKDVLGDVTHFVAVKRDITARKRVERDLAEARDRADAAARAKSDFLANMSHEIRTPMNAVIGMTGLLLDTELSAEQRECAETVHSAGETLLGVVNDILDFSKIEAGGLELELLDFDLRELVEDATALMAEQAERKGLEMVCDLDADLPATLSGDAGRLRQILLNLVGNAVKFTSKGEVCVRARCAEETADEIVVRIEVIDTGMGVSPENAKRLFERFSQADESTTRRFGGTGLGLAISRRLAELMGGEIGVESDGRRGSTFWFTARLTRSNAQAATQPVVSCDFSGVRVLVIDDNATNRKILRHRLLHWGMRCGEAASGPAGLQLLGESVEAQDPFHLAIVDMQMPGLDGLDVAAAIRCDERLGELPVVLLTSIGGQDLRRQALAGGVAACLTKPVRQGKLFDCLAQVVGVGPAPAPAEPDARTLPTVQPGPHRILVVEDNAVNQRVAVRLLERLGYRADVAANGREALAALRLAPYDLVLMDCQMPEMDGYEATQAIRADEAAGGGPHMPIVALTAHAMEGEATRCYAAGMDDYLTKPVTRERLGEVLRRWLIECERYERHGARDTVPGKTAR